MQSSFFTHLSKCVSKVFLSNVHFEIILFIIKYLFIQRDFFNFANHLLE